MSRRDGIGVLYLQPSPDGLILAGGAWPPCTMTLGKFRAVVDDPRNAASFDEPVAWLEPGSR